MQTQITLLDFPPSLSNTGNKLCYVNARCHKLTVSHCLQERLARFLSYFLNCLCNKYIQNKQHMTMAKVITYNTGYAIKSACIWQGGLTCHCLAKKPRIWLSSASKCLSAPVNQTALN